jgi:hypothetical protein
MTANTGPLVHQMRPQSGGWTLYRRDRSTGGSDRDVKCEGRAVASDVGQKMTHFLPTLASPCRVEVGKR